MIHDAIKPIKIKIKNQVAKNYTMNDFCVMTLRSFMNRRLFKFYLLLIEKLNRRKKEISRGKFNARFWLHNHRHW
jgi:hypothetical protein